MKGTTTAALVAVATVVLLATLPGCGSHLECPRSQCDQAWCEGGTVVWCSCGSDPDGGLVSTLHKALCSDLGMACVTVLDDPTDKGREAVCMDPCDGPGQFRCQQGGATSSLHECSEYDPHVSVTSETCPECPAAAMAHTSRLGPTEELGAWAYKGFYHWGDTGGACIPCASSCGCGEKEKCVDGLCIAGKPEDGLTCCKRENGAPCPDGSPCETVAGTLSTCETAARCEPCEKLSDCASSDCVATVAAQGKVCVAEWESSSISKACRDDLNELWTKDVCGAWISLDKACGDGFRCEAGACYENLPNIEVSPSLLPFGETPLSGTKSLDLFVGNTGLAPLTIHEVVVEADGADVYQISASKLVVSVDDIETITVTFAPKELGEVNAKLLVRSNDSDTPEFTVLMSATAVPD